MFLGLESRFALFSHYAQLSLKDGAGLDHQLSRRHIPLQVTRGTERHATLDHDISFDASGDVCFPRLDPTTHFSVRTNLNDPVQLDIALDFSVTDEVAGPANTAYEAEAIAQKVGVLLFTPVSKQPDLLNPI